MRKANQYPVLRFFDSPSMKLFGSRKPGTPAADTCASPISSWERARQIWSESPARIHTSLEERMDDLGPTLRA